MKLFSLVGVLISASIPSMARAQITPPTSATGTKPLPASVPSKGVKIQPSAASLQAGPGRRAPSAGASLQPGGPGSSALLIGGSDICATADPITGNGPFAFNNAFATTGAEGQNNCICTFFGVIGIDNDVWFDWTASFSGPARVSMCAGSSHDAKLAVYDGNNCATSPAIACDDDACVFAGPSQTSFQCTLGNHYLIEIGCYPGTLGSPGSFTIAALAPPPSNDSCAAPTMIAGAGPHPFDNTQATTGMEGQCNSACDLNGAPGIGDDIWFEWTAGFTGPAKVSLCLGTVHDSKVAVYAGSGCPAGAPLSCDDDFCGFAAASQATFAAVNGNLYTIQLGNFPNAAGAAGTFTVDPYVPQPGDDCSNPFVISGPGPHAFDNTQATTGAEGQNNANCFFFGTTGITSDLWYTWTAPCDGTTTLSLCAGSSNDTKIAAYDGAGCPAAMALACDDDFCGFAMASEISFTVVGGNAYTLQIGMYPGTPGAPGSFSTNTVCSLPGTPFCAGDSFDPGVTQACPCSNFGSMGHGCANSANSAGALLVSSGTVAADNVVLHGSNMPATVACIYLKGDMQLGGGEIFGDGVRCAGGTLIRLRTKINMGGASQFPDIGDPTLSFRGGTPVGSGLTGYYQTYYRNSAAAFCPPATFNVTNGLFIVW